MEKIRNKLLGEHAKLKHNHFKVLSNHFFYSLTLNFDCHLKAPPPLKTQSSICDRSTDNKKHLSQEKTSEMYSPMISTAERAYKKRIIVIYSESAKFNASQSLPDQVKIILKKV